MVVAVLVAVVGERKWEWDQGSGDWECGLLDVDLGEDLAGKGEAEGEAQSSLDEVTPMPPCGGSS